jgi:sulfur transfer protein SufE
MTSSLVSTGWEHHTLLVIGKAGNDPRLEGDASAKIFRGMLVVVKRRYANKVFVENLRKTIFDTLGLPYPNVSREQTHRS